MYDRLEIFNMAQGLATHASARQSKIATNVANADTPGFRAQDIAPFEDSYRVKGGGGHMRSTRAEHHLTEDAGPYSAHAIDRPGPSSPNGNTVSLETEMVNAVEVKQSHELALTIYQTSLGILRTSLGRGR